MFLYCFEKEPITRNGGKNILTSQPSKILTPSPSSLRKPARTSRGKRRSQSTPLLKQGRSDGDLALAAIKNNPQNFVFWGFFVFLPNPSRRRLTSKNRLSILYEMNVTPAFQNDGVGRAIFAGATRENARINRGDGGVLKSERRSNRKRNYGVSKLRRRSFPSCAFWSRKFSRVKKPRVLRLLKPRRLEPRFCVFGGVFSGSGRQRGAL